MVVGLIMVVIGIVIFFAGYGSLAALLTTIPAILFVVGGLICIGVSASRQSGSDEEQAPSTETEADAGVTYPGFISEKAQAENDDRSIVTRYDPASDREVPEEVKNALERAYIALSYFQFDEAAGHFDRVLDLDPHFAPAYMGKLLCSLGIRDERNLPFTTATFTKDHNWELACRFATDEELSRYNGYLDQARAEREKIRQQREAEMAQSGKKRKK